MVELVKQSENKPIEKCCRKPCKSAKVHAKGYFSNILDDIEEFKFNYVEGQYFLRYRNCSCAGATCFTCKTLHCSDGYTFGDSDGSEEDKVQENCGNKTSSYLSTFTTYPSDLDNEDKCDLEVNIVFPSCSGILPYSTAQVTVYESNQDGVCPEKFSGLKLIESNEENINSCNSTLCPPVNDVDLGLVTFDFVSDMNTSYCIHLQEAGPVCQANAGLCSVHYYSPVHCREPHRPTLTFLPLSEPIFIGCVCGVLLLSLLLLLWTVVKCKKEQTTPNSSPEPELIKSRNIPRSLTIDEMEHICRLRHQELVLVYFPDSERFKNLNRLFKNWLMSLTTLNVNDVTDIYDEKYGDGPDGILQNPDAWVSNLLSDPERRVILVTSKLAFECLLHIRKGLQPPKFALDDTHSQILFSILKLLDSEMFRGNYRRLICVRYEDLKICSRKYGSESFNIVPGTEYVLPPHLEDIARWIHPIEAKPGLWADHRPQVKQFFDALREYRHHEVSSFLVLTKVCFQV